MKLVAENSERQNILGHHPRKSQIITSLLIGLAIFLFHLPFVQNDLFFDDAADYVRASQSSLLATWLNTNSVSPFELLSLRHDSEFRAHPWDYLYFTEDNTALRHFHGPLTFYVMNIVGRFASIRAQRLVPSCVTAITCAWLVLIFTEFHVQLALASMLSLLAGVQSRFIETSIDPTPHSWFMLFAVSFLYFLTCFLKRGKKIDLYFCVTCFSFAFATLEFSVALLACVPLLLFLIGLIDRTLLPTWAQIKRPLVKATGLYLLLTVLIWPGGWMRAGYFEDYAVLGATVLSNRHAAFGGKFTLGLLYQTVFAHHLILLLILLFSVAGIIILIFQRHASIPTIVFSSYSFIAFGIGSADHFRLSTYVSEFLLFMIGSAGLIYSDLLRMLSLRQVSRRICHFAACLIIALGCNEEWQQRNAAMEFRPWLAPILLGLDQKVPHGETILVTDDWEALILYLPNHRLEPTASKASRVPRSPRRAINVNYFLFDGKVQPAAGSSRVSEFATYPGHTEVLWKTPKIVSPKAQQ